MVLQRRYGHGLSRTSKGLISFDFSDFSAFRVSKKTWTDNRQGFRYHENQVPYTLWYNVVLSLCVPDSTDFPNHVLPHRVVCPCCRRHYDSVQGVNGHHKCMRPNIEDARPNPRIQNNDVAVRQHTFFAVTACTISFSSFYLAEGVAVRPPYVCMMAYTERTVLSDGDEGKT